MWPSHYSERLLALEGSGLVGSAFFDLLDPGLENANFLEQVGDPGAETVDVAPLVRDDLLVALRLLFDRVVLDLLEKTLNARREVDGQPAHTLKLVLVISIKPLALARVRATRHRVNVLGCGVFLNKKMIVFVFY